MKLSRNLMIIGVAIILAVVAVTWAFRQSEPILQEPRSQEPISPELMQVKKPVIYLYPTKQETVSIKLNFSGQLTCTYPDYKNGWNVIAAPDGTMSNLDDKKQYSCLFWEGVSNEAKWDLSKGFVVAGKDTKDFLQEKLAFLGLTPKEYNEFIVYWLPVMQNNKFNLVTFAGREYEEIAPMQITPSPDSELRVFMVFKPLDSYMEIQPQELQSFERVGFTVVEWGGTELKKDHLD